MLASRFGVRWSGEKSQPAPAALAEIPFGDEGDAEKAKYPHCNLTNVQLLGDVAILVATAGVAHEIGTISPVALILAAAAPVPIAMLQPFVSKNAYAAGLMRLRRDNEVDDDGVEKKYPLFKWAIKGARPVLNIASMHFMQAAAPPNGVYVWAMMSFRKANTIRITVYGPGNPSPRVFQASGCDIATALEMRDGKLTMVIYERNTTDEKECTLGVDPRDGVQIVTCGNRPRLTKHYVSVDGGSVSLQTVYDNSRTWMMGVMNPQRNYTDARL